MDRSDLFDNDAARVFLFDHLVASKIDMADLSRRIGRNHAYIQQYLKRGIPRCLPHPIRIKVAGELGIQHADLLPSDAEPELVEAAGYADAIRIKSGAGAKALGNGHGVSIRELDVRAGAGGGGVYHTETVEDVGGGLTVNVHEVKSEWTLPETYVRQELKVSPDAAEIIEILGDSMAPTLESGDRVLVDRNHRLPTPPGVYALFDGYGVVVKRIEIVHGADPSTIRVISDNPHHSTYEITLDEAQIIGRVVWKTALL